LKFPHNKKSQRIAITEEQYTTKRRKLKRRKFQHLAREKRAQIEILLKQGLAKTKIAKAVGISRSTINDFQNPIVKSFKK